MRADNPFFHRGALRDASDFFGRDAVVAEVLGLLRNRQSVSIVGPRRIGKSSLLMHLCRPPVRQPFGIANDKMRFVLIDCQELSVSPAEEVYEIIHAGLLSAEANTAQPAAVPGTYRALDRTLRSLAQQNIGVVILLDEFELLAANPELSPHFFARLRGLTTKHGLAFITASQRPLYAVTADEAILSSPFFNIFVTVSLGLYSEAEARGLLDARMAHRSPSFPPDLCDHLLELVGYHPFFLHIAGYHAFQALQQGDDPADDNFRRALDDAVEIEAHSHLNYLWRNLTAEEKYALVTKDGPIDALRLLEQQCLIHMVGDKMAFTSQILHRFVRRQVVDSVIQAEPFVIDELRHRVHVDGSEVSLTNSQFDLLSCMALQAGHVVPGSILEQAVWGDEVLDDPDRLKTLIKRLRRAIEPYGNWIVSERGVGYALRRPG